jgi:hypothetical protein
MVPNLVFFGESEMKIQLSDGKYTAIFEEDTGKLYASRYGEQWRDLCGDKFVYCLMAKIEESALLAEECLKIVDFLDRDPLSLFSLRKHEIRTRLHEIKNGVELEQNRETNPE